jgi:hypothetical protein
MKQQFKRFQNDALPPQTPGESRLKFLERDLGSLFRPSKDRVPPPKGEVDPLAIHFIEAPKAVPSDGKLFTTAAFRVSLKDDVGGKSVPVILRIEVPVLEDENSADGDLLPLSLESDLTTEPAKSDGAVELPFIVEKGETYTFRLQTDLYEPTWSTRVIVRLNNRTEAADGR